jgi:fatty acid-binding protein DegV
MNPGVASVGLCALIHALAEFAPDSSIENVVALVDELEPGCDTLFIPATTSWLDRAGKLALIEDRLGPLKDRVPVLRVGTRITPVAAEPSQAEAVHRLLEIAGARAGRGTPVAAVVDHANALPLAVDVATHLRNRLTVAELAITELSPTIGTLLGPGAVGVGVCPMGGSNA